MSVLPLSMTNPSDVLDMPVDPNEPTYCLCHQVSYGEMIGCDNPDVSIVKVLTFWGSAVAWWLRPRTPDPEVRGQTVFCP